MLPKHPTNYYHDRTLKQLAILKTDNKLKQAVKSVVAFTNCTYGELCSR